MCLCHNIRDNLKSQRQKEEHFLRVFGTLGYDFRCVVRKL